MFFFGPNRRLALAIACLIAGSIHGQFNQSFFKAKSHQMDSGQFAFQPEVTPFVRNSEYQNLITEGRTHLGVQLWPQASYQLNDHHRITLGIFARQDFGGDDFQTVIPTFRWTFQKGRNQVNIGAIDGAFNHGLIDPLYHPERWITHRVEQGIQYQRQGQNLEADAWLNWEKMIYPNSPFREAFTAGVSLLVKALKTDQLSIDFPIQGLVKHEGGEIDNTNLPVTSRYNGYAGIKLQATPGEHWQFFLEAGATGYEDLSSTPADTFFDGKGHLGLLGVARSNWRLDFLYWDSYQFQSPMGNPVYQSRSVQNRNYLFFYGKVASARLTYQKELQSNLSFMVRGEVLNHSLRNWTDFTLECYLRYQPFFLK